MSEGLELLRKRRGEILALAARFGATDMRVFGSVARGQDRGDSDVDLLVRFERGRSLLDHAGLELVLQELLGRRVEVASEGGLRTRYRERILAEAVPV
jgi:predicted nucleotidyltransferase